MKKITAEILLGILMITTFTGCGNRAKEASGNDVENAGDEMAIEEAEPAKKVAVFFSGTCSDEMENLETVFESELAAKEEENFEVQFFYAEEKETLQIEQIEKMLTEEVEAIVVEPVDTYGLTECLEAAKQQEIPVISYNHLIMDTDAVSYYVTYSYREMGNLIGETIKEEKKLDRAREEQQSYSIEFLMGSQDSLEALFFYNGVMEILQEYFDDGTLICPSGMTSFDDTGILRWDEKKAQKRMDDILASAYEEGMAPDIVCTGFDAAAACAAESLRDAGIFVGSENYPMITGAASETDELATITSEEQYCTVYLNQTTLVEICAQMTAICAAGETPEVNDKSQFDNGVKIIATNICEPVLITKENNGKAEEKESDMEIEEETDAESQEEDAWEEVDVENDEERDSLEAD